MRSIRSKNTRPELVVRRLLRELGYGYRLHRRDLPGRPDIAFIGRRKVIFVHGCFWHQHEGVECPLVKSPKSRLEYWVPKLERNRSRDLRNVKQLQNAGWQTLTVWECEIDDTGLLAQRLRRFLEAQSDPHAA